MALEITPEIQEAIDKAVEAATEGLKANNQKLIKEKRDLQAKVGGVDADQFAALEAERDELKGQVTKLNKDLKKATDDLGIATKSLETETNFTQNLLIDNGLLAELTEVGVKNPAHLKATQAMLRGQVQIVADGDKRIAKVGDKALKDFVKEWAAGDEGKHFVQAPGNAGGGASGGSGGAAGKTMARAAFDALGQGERAAFISEGGKLTD